MKKQISNMSTLVLLVFISYLYLFCDVNDIESLTARIIVASYVAPFICITLFIVKCFVTLIPMGVLYIFCGYALPPWQALWVCIVGSCLCFSYSYYEGKKRKDKRAIYITAHFNDCGSAIFPALFLHSIRIFPQHIAGIYFGAAGLPFFEYMLGCIIGMLPSVLLSLSIAKALPKISHSFLISVSVVILILIVCSLYTKNKKVKQNNKKHG